MIQALVAATVIGAVGGAAVGIVVCQWATYHAVRHIITRQANKAPSSPSGE